MFVVEINNSSKDITNMGVITQYENDWI
jgi:hypothetical protein